MAADIDTLSLTNTPTWAVAAVCAIFVVLSIFVERTIHNLGQFLLQNKQKPLYEALQKMKEELMVLGFVSLLLTAAHSVITKVCIPESWAIHMLPCYDDENSNSLGRGAGPSLVSAGAPPAGLRNRRFLSVDSDVLSTPFRVLRGRNMEAVGDEGVHTALQCSQGYTRVFSTDSLHELHMFIFVLAVVHVFYSCLALLLGFTQLRSWRKWEEESNINNPDKVSNDSLSFVVERQGSFVTSRTGNSWCKTCIGSWVSSFFRQFGNAVTKSDYMSLRMGFIKKHNAPKRFNFHEYMMSTLEADFKKVVGISGFLWVFVVLFMILNIHGWYLYFWISFIPILINLVIGTKLQHVITQLALETAESDVEIPVPIKPRDDLFWFKRPRLVLYLIHFVLFQNAFELSYCLWVLSTFGIHSCLVGSHRFIFIRVIVGFLAQVLCSYSTLPLYALVTQMGSHYKEAMFEYPVKSTIHGWPSTPKNNSKIWSDFDNLNSQVIESDSDIKRRRVIDSSMRKPTPSLAQHLRKVNIFSTGHLPDDFTHMEKVTNRSSMTHLQHGRDVEGAHIFSGGEIPDKQATKVASGETIGPTTHVRSTLQTLSEETKESETSPTSIVSPLHESISL